MNNDAGEARPRQAAVDQENDRDRIISELTKANVVLKANISTLFRTARAEIARKNERIAELQAELDNLLFKRMSGSGKPRDATKTNHEVPTRLSSFGAKIRNFDERRELAAEANGQN